ncbi:hypothetical protein ACRE_090500 [Hapsidospora chrysogenum ATCC 11550]|uniref:Uncharacterized protein n=1 Tax=Hapsidospora chrysogenum (strain ATCC 11550 / CBS 779.69 / DSM 880 / IAM 14645 / JCM 23072 / IMI 49137) TaxID=857340 RepID=A0A086ST56_HAPC1|nr:hypothetical protein ACRE_090500 [Hapsidospora chrysogenum ATCC 11550]
MNGDQPTDEQKPPLASPAVSANGSNAGGKKRKKEGLKPIITIESGSQAQASGRSTFCEQSVGRREGLEWVSLVGTADDRVCPSPQQPLKRKCVPETFGCCWLFELLAFFVLGSSALACCIGPEQLTSEDARESTSITWVIGRIGCWDPRSPERLPASLVLFGIGAVRMRAYECPRRLHGCAVARGTTERRAAGEEGPNAPPPMQMRVAGSVSNF